MVRKKLMREQYGVMEQTHAKKLRQSRINQAVLATIALSGGLALAAVAPGALALLKYTRNLPQRKRELSNTLSRALERGYVVLSNTNGRKRVVLTERGRAYVSLIDEEKFRLKKQPRWDGKFRVLIFDVPEKRRYLRDKLRLYLVTLGFIRLQDSVWVTPYPCDETILTLKAELKLGTATVRYMIVEQIENDTYLRQHFSLPLP